jgi:flagellar biosynthesis anti-sigma factor FlgM
MDVHDRSTYTSSLENLGLAGTALESAAKLRADNTSASDATNTAAGNDSSQLSPAAQAVAQTMQMPEIRQDRVASLQQQIAGGNYQVEAQSVADAMLRHLAD